MENVPARCRFDSRQCTKHEYCLSVDSQPVVEYPRTPAAAAAHGRGMAATLAVIQLDDVQVLTSEKNAFSAEPNLAQDHVG